MKAEKNTREKKKERKRERVEVPVTRMRSRATSVIPSCFFIVKRRPMGWGGEGMGGAIQCSSNYMQRRTKPTYVPSELT